MATLPGFRAVHRRLYDRIRPSEVEVAVRGMRIVVDPRDEVVAATLICDGDWEPYEADLFEAAISPGMTVVDVGANVGYYTLLAARAVGPLGRVVAVEPDRNNFRLLCQNIQLNGFGDRVTTLPIALGNEQGMKKLYRDCTNLAAHSLSEHNVEGDDWLDVPVLTLAEALKQHGLSRIDVMKMDVQGAEGQVLAGSREFVRQGCDRAFLEFWPRGLANVGTDPGALLKAIHGDFGFRISLIRSDAQRLVEVTDPVQVLDRCARLDQVDLLLERADIPRLNAPLGHPASLHH